MLHKRKWWLRSLVIAGALFLITGCTNSDGNVNNAGQEETPAETNEGAAPAKEENNGAAPAKEENNGAAPAKEENNGAAPAKEENNGAAPAKEENNGNKENAQQPNSNITGLKADEDLETQMEQDPGIEDVMIQVVEGAQPAVNVDIQISEPQELSADELIEKYSGVIKEKYPDHKIDIIVVKAGKVLKQTQLQ